jgi:hypothetical protein
MLVVIYFLVAPPAAALRQEKRSRRMPSGELLIKLSSLMIMGARDGQRFIRGRRSRSNFWFSSCASSSVLKVFFSVLHSASSSAPRFLFFSPSTTILNENEFSSNLSLYKRERKKSARCCVFSFVFFNSLPFPKFALAFNDGKRRKKYIRKIFRFLFEADSFHGRRQDEEEHSEEDKLGE